MKTTGDIILDRTLDKIGGKGLFVQELFVAILFFVNKEKDQKKNFLEFPLYRKSIFVRTGWFLQHFPYPLSRLGGSAVVRTVPHNPRHQPRALADGGEKEIAVRRTVRAVEENPLPPGLPAHGGVHRFVVRGGHRQKGAGQIPVPVGPGEGGVWPWTPIWCS